MVIAWQNAASPLIEGDLVLVNCNGRPGEHLLAFRKLDGALVWKGQSDGMTQSSPVAANIGGVRQAIFFAQSGLVSVAPQTGDANYNAAPSVQYRFTVIANTAPALDMIPAQTIDEGKTLTLTMRVSDPDVPAQTLAFGLVGNAPEGASLNPSTGVFTWTPTETQGPASYNFTVQVSDNGDPLRSFRLTVPEGRRAKVQTSTDLITWVDLRPEPLTGGAEVTDPVLPNFTCGFIAS